MSETTRFGTGTPDLGRAAIAEFIASFALVFIGAGALVAGNLGLGLVGVALATGSVLAAMVIVIRHLSGAHVNPAVTIGLCVSRRTAPGRAAVYIAAQVLGAIAGGLVVRYLVPGALYTAAVGGAPSLEATVGAGKGIAIEAIATFILVFVYFGAVVDARSGSEHSAGVALGLTLAAGIMVFGPYTGAAMNPVRWLGPAFAARQWADWYVWIAGPLLGGIVAAAVYRWIFLQAAVGGAAERTADR